jgi:hypothetical protein
MTVSGAKYPCSRARGYADWNPQAGSLQLLAEINVQLDLWADLWPLTARQIFYGLIGRGVIDKTESNYSKITEKLNLGRRSGRVSWDAIRDDGARFVEPNQFESVAHFWRFVESLAGGFRLPRQAEQEQHIEVWCEAAGMVPQLQKVAFPYGVGVATSGGFDSTTSKYLSAQRFLARDLPTVVLHVGDLDSSGLAIVDSAAEDVEAFCSRDKQGHVEFRRLAVTLDQVEELGLQTAPAKGTDNRGEEPIKETVQAEAIPPAELAQIVRDGIEELLDPDLQEATLEREEVERESLAEDVATIRRQQERLR